MSHPLAVALALRKATYVETEVLDINAVGRDAGYWVEPLRFEPKKLGEVNEDAVRVDAERGLSSLQDVANVGHRETDAVKGAGHDAGRPILHALAPERPPPLPHPPTRPKRRLLSRR